MGLRIGTNVASLSAQRQLGRAEERTGHALQALSSGSRIVRPADDAAGFAIAESLHAQASSLLQAKFNADNAKGFIQVAEGGLNEQGNILIRLRELAVQSASDTLSDDERKYIDTEFQALKSESDRIAHTTTYGKRTLLQGSDEEYQFQLGVHNTSNDSITFRNSADTTNSALGISGLSVADRGDARDSLEDLDSAVDKISKIRAELGAVQSRLEIASNQVDEQHENIASAYSRIHDADIAHETTEMTLGRIQQDFSAAVLAQANQSSERAIKLIG
jgi:flagellin